MSGCAHPDETLYWVVNEKHEAACNEAGWFCGNCSALLGFRPDLDRSEAEVKVQSVLLRLHDTGFVYVSNGTQGDLVIEHVARRCEEQNAYDQYSILRFLLEDPNLGGTHAGFWQKEARDWFAAQRGAGR
jgi:hypothetical protein